jgi:hypothetical protein
VAAHANAARVVPRYLPRYHRVPQVIVSNVVYRGGGRKGSWNMKRRMRKGSRIDRSDGVRDILKECQASNREIDRAAYSRSLGTYLR